MTNLEKLLKHLPKKESVEIHLSSATFKAVCEALGQSNFHIQNPEDSLVKHSSELSFDFWKKQTLAKYPNASLVITKGADWFNEVTVSDPFFKFDRDNYTGAKSHYLKSTGYSS